MFLILNRIPVFKQIANTCTPVRTPAIQTNFTIQPMSSDPEPSYVPHDTFASEPSSNIPARQMVHVCNMHKYDLLIAHSSG